MRKAGPAEELYGSGGVGVGEAEYILDEVGGWVNGNGGQSSGEGVGSDAGEDLEDGFGIRRDVIGFQVGPGLIHGFQFLGPKKTVEW